ncbi:MIR domain protein (macronuclear) [Tetrahymena thermophila SB210]|uniref:MIR domain protein n=1 Tax=Tetrahymena thermophila (strain SB210) TaxID=312017 RepID=Q22BP6_TETTS|nr:MIR domain protein [Tetrahymena thermophila SB210]EAR82683.2 MIR domain protein [Tetrahymena thermophila SB210]|eukprot:XP_001030346.2 MIR domain protein [Tetrahymena thermophila SB210]
MSTKRSFTSLLPDLVSFQKIGSAQGSPRNAYPQDQQQLSKTKVQQKDSILRYGQVIEICGINQNHKGLLYSKGWTDRNICFVESKNLSDVSNKRECFFRILPKGTFYIHDEYSKSNEQDKLLLESRLARELKNYENLVIQMNGTVVHFGSEVILQHLDSGEYLYGTQKCPDVPSDSFKLKIKSQLKSMNLFKIIPTNFYDIEGDEVSLGQEIYLMHVKTGYCVDVFRKKQIIYDEQQYQAFQSIEEFIQLKRPTKGDKRFRGILTNSRDTIWSFNLVFNHTYKDDDNIYNFDLVQIIHNNKNSILSKSNLGNKLILKEQEQSSIIPIYDSIFEISKIQNKQNKFYLRHFISGELITINNKDNPNATSQNTIQNKKTKQISTEQNQIQEVKNENDIVIKNKNQSMQSSQNTARDKSKQINEYYHDQEEKKFAKLDQNLPVNDQFQININDKKIFSGFSSLQRNNELYKDSQQQLKKSNLTGASDSDSKNNKLKREKIFKQVVSGDSSPAQSQTNLDETELKQIEINQERISEQASLEQSQSFQDCKFQSQRLSLDVNTQILSNQLQAVNPFRRKSQLNLLEITKNINKNSLYESQKQYAGQQESHVQTQEHHNKQSSPKQIHIKKKYRESEGTNSDNADDDDETQNKIDSENINKYLGHQPALKKQNSNQSQKGNIEKHIKFSQSSNKQQIYFQNEPLFLQKNEEQHMLQFNTKSNENLVIPLKTISDMEQSNVQPNYEFILTEKNSQSFQQQIEINLVLRNGISIQKKQEQLQSYSTYYYLNQDENNCDNSLDEDIKENHKNNFISYNQYEQPILRQSPCFVKFIYEKQEFIEFHNDEDQSKQAENQLPQIPNLKNQISQSKKKFLQRQSTRSYSSKFSLPKFEKLSSLPSRKARLSNSTLHFETSIQDMVKRQQECQEILCETRQCGFAIKKSRSGFRIEKIPPSTKKVILWALSVKEQLYYFCSALHCTHDKNVLHKKITHKCIKQTIKCLLSINSPLEDDNQYEEDMTQGIGASINRTDSSQKVYTSLNGNPFLQGSGSCKNSEYIYDSLKQIQCILIDTKVAFLIVYILYSMVYSHNVFSLFEDDEMKSTSLKQLLRLCYVVLKNIVKNNQKAKLIICQNLEVFIYHAFQMQDESQIQLFLSELFYDNYRTISDLISPSSIQNIIQQIYKQKLPHPFHCKILSAVTQCNNMAISSNQNCIIDYFFKAKRFHPAFHFEFITEESDNILQQLNKTEESQLDSSQSADLNKKQIFIQCIADKESNLSKVMKISELQRISYENNDNQRMFKYFISYIDLLANICYSRNKNGKELIESIISIDQILSLITLNRSIIQGSLKTPFIKLLQNAYIDVPSSFVVPKILKVRQWNLVKFQCGINQSSNNRHIQESSKVLDYVFEFFNVCDELSNVDDSINLEILTMLEIFKKMIDLGIQSDNTQINNFIPTLINILKSKAVQKSNGILRSQRSLDYKKRGNGSSIISSVNFSIVQKCKQLITDILQEYLDIQINIQIGQILKQFKEYNEDHTEESNFMNQISQGQFEKINDQISKKWKDFFDYNNLQIKDTPNSNQEFLHYLDDIDITLMKELLQKNNTSIFDSILLLLKRVFQQKRELYQNLQKIILVKGGLAEQISKNIPKYRQQFEILKDSYFLTELNKPLEVQDGPSAKAEIGLESFVKLRSYSRHFSDKKELHTSDSVQTDRQTPEVRPIIKSSFSNLKITLVSNSDADYSTSQNKNTNNNIDIDWKNFGLTDTNQHIALDLPPMVQQNSDYLSIPIRNNNRRFSNLSEDKSNQSSYSIDKDVNKMINKQIMLHDDEKCLTPQSIKLNQDDNQNNQFFVKDKTASGNKDLEEVDFKRASSNSSANNSKKMNISISPLMFPQLNKIKSLEGIQDQLKLDFKQTSMKEERQNYDESGDKKQKDDVEDSLSNQSMTFNFNKGDDTVTSKLGGAELFENRELKKEISNIQKGNDQQSLDFFSIQEIQSLHFGIKEVNTNFCNSNHSIGNEIINQSLNTNENILAENQQLNNSKEQNNQMKYLFKIQLENQKDHSDLSPINKNNEDYEDSPMSIYNENQQAAKRQQQYQNNKRKSGFYTNESTQKEFKKNPLTTLPPSIILEQSDQSEITNMVHSRQNSIQSPLKQHEPISKLINDKLKLNISEVNTSEVESDSQKQIFNQQIKLRSKANYEFIITDLVQLTHFMKNYPKQIKDQRLEESSQLVTDDIFSNQKYERELKNFINERELNNLLIQNLVRSHDLHPTLFQFLSQLDKNFISLKSQILIQQIYEFLTVMIWNNHEAKMELLKAKNIAFSQIELNLGALEFLKELYTNVKPLLLNQSEIIRVTQSVLKIVNKNTNNINFQSKLISFLRTLIILNDNPIKINQGIIYQEIQNKSYKNLQIFDLEFQEEILNNLPKYISEYEKSFDQCATTQKINIPTQIAYMMSIFSLFSMLVEGQNEVNLRKSIKLHPLKFLISIMEKCSICTPLKKEIRTYINRVYYNQQYIQNKNNLLNKRQPISKGLVQSFSLQFEENDENNQSKNNQELNISLQQNQSKGKDGEIFNDLKVNNQRSSIKDESTVNSILIESNSESITLNKNMLSSHLSIIPEVQEHERRGSSLGSLIFTPVSNQNIQSGLQNEMQSPKFPIHQSIFKSVSQLQVLNEQNEEEQNQKDKSDSQVESVESDSASKTNSQQPNSSENLKSLNDLNIMPDQIEDDFNQNKILETVKENFDGEQELSQINLEKRQKQICSNKQNFKRQMQSSFFNEYNVKEQQSFLPNKKSIFEKNGMLLEVIKDLGCISNDLSEYVYLLQNNSQFENVEINNYIRLKYYKSYAVLHFKEIVYSLFFLFGNKNFTELLKNQLQFVLKQKDKQENPHRILISIVNSLMQILKLSNYLSQPIKQIIRKLYEIIKTFDFKSLNLQNLKFTESTIYQSPLRAAEINDSMLISSINNTMLNQSICHTQEIKGAQYEALKWVMQTNQQNENQDKQLLSNIKSFIRLYDQSGNDLKQSINITKKSKLSKNQLSEDMNEVLNNQLKFELYVLDNSKSFQDYLKNESDKLFQTHWDEDDINDDQMLIKNISHDAISKKKFIQSILDTAISNQHLPDDLHIFYLNILIRMIQDQNPQTDGMIKEIDTWDTPYWKGNKEKIESMQTLVYNQGGAKLICNLLKQPNLEQRLGLVSHILQFGISLLIGGHRKIQNRILTNMKEDLDNMILININTLIQKIGKIIYRFSKEQLREKSIPQINLSDTHDYYDSVSQIMVRKNTKNPDDYKEDQFKALCIQVMKRIFRFLQLCCESSNIDMKDYMRQQTFIDNRPKSNSLNFIIIATEINREFLKIINKNVVEIPIIISEFLIEVAQVPCLQNQISLCQTSYFEDISLLSQFIEQVEEKTKTLISFNSQQPEEEINLLDLYSKAIQTALVVFEGNDPQIYEEVMSKISVEFMQIIVNKRLKLMKVENVQQLKAYIQTHEIRGYYDKHVVEIFNVLIIIKRCQEYDANVKDRFYTNILKEQEILECLNSKIATIEIYHQKKFKQIYLPLVPLYNFLSDITKEKIMKNVNRQSQRDKIIDLLSHQSVVFDEMNHNYQLSKNKVPATGDNVQLIQTIITYFSLFLNMYLAMSAMIQIDPELGMNLKFHHYETKHNIFSLVFLFFILVTTFIFFTAINQVPPKINFQENFWNRFLLLCKNDQAPYLFVLMLSSILSLIIHPKYIVLSLPYSFSKLKLVQGVVENLYQALFIQRKQLVLVSFLGVLFLYIFSVLSFNNYYQELYSSDEIVNDEKTCNSMLSCMITLTLSGVVGNSNTHWEFSTFITDTVYFVFMSILFTNIISGIMTDTFAEMRDKRNFIESDKKNRCYICGIERATLEKKDLIFEEHIKKHNLWEYLFYIQSIILKEETEYTGIESIIKDKLKKDDITWIPNNTSLNT